MSTKEALPKAAFQYGVKMQDGRKTRKNKTEKNEKAELDREWQKIQVNSIKTMGNIVDLLIITFVIICRILYTRGKIKAERAEMQMNLIIRKQNTNLLLSLLV